MSLPKFTVGDQVRLETRARLRVASNATYDVIHVLPSDDIEAVYRLKARDEPFERTAFEHEMTWERRPEAERIPLSAEPRKTGRVPSVTTRWERR